MSMATQTWDALIAESRGIEKLAQKVQGKDGSPEADDELRGRYDEWYASCLAILPPELIDEFRSAYMGDGDHPRIRDFLANPRAIVVGQGYAVGGGRRYVPDGVGSFTIVETLAQSYTPRWHRYSYGEHFLPHLLAQRTLLVVASKRVVRSLVVSDPVTLVEHLATSFHRCANQLLQRHDKRAPFEIEDEYDVQDLFHALLRLFFSDVRAEQDGPAFAGAQSRIDFLLPAERMGIEIKKTHARLKDGDLGKQLIDDINRYSGHPTCETLVIFVYDPEKRVSNPAGLKANLERPRARDMAVHAVINQG